MRSDLLGQARPGGWRPCARRGTVVRHTEAVLAAPLAWRAGALSILPAGVSVTAQCKAGQVSPGRRLTPTSCPPPGLGDQGTPPASRAAGRRRTLDDALAVVRFNGSR